MDILLENFKYLTTTPKNVAQLKKLVLQLAVQGKLTTQWRTDNPDVEPASVLLKKIEAGKVQLIKEGKAKKGKPHSKISDEETPFVLPIKWVWCRMSEAGLFERGKSKHRPRNDKSLFDDGTIPFVQTGDVAQSRNFGYRIKNCSSYYNAKGLAQSRLWAKDTLCITIAANIALTGYLDFEACFPDSVVGFTSLVGHSVSQYLRYFIDLTKEDIEQFAPATAQKNINLSILNDLIFPLPPLPEQQVIVSKVESLFEQIDQLHSLAQKKVKYRENTAKALFNKINTVKNDTELQETWHLLNSNFKTLTQSKESVKQLRQSILQLAVQGKLTANWRKENPDVEPASVLLEKIKAEKEQLIKEGKFRREKPLPKISDEEKIFELPESWEWVRLIDYGLTNTGTTPSKNNPEFFGKDYSFVKPAEISLKGINYATEDGLSELGIKQGRIIPKNSVLMVCIGGSIGKSYFTDRVVSCNQQINTITPLASISAEFVNYLLQSVYFQFEIWDRASGATTPIINKGKWERIPVSLPPIEEQKQIVSKVNQLMVWCDELEEKIEKRNAYQERIMQAVVKQAI